MAVSLITMAACRIALAYLFVKGFHQDVLWIWYAMYADWIVRVIVYLTAFKNLLHLVFVLLCVIH